MKIILIGPGNKNIPPKGWGACESIVWDYYCNLKKYQEIDVEFISEENYRKIVDLTNAKNPDIIHIMYDDYFFLANYFICRKIYLTTHFAYITSKDFKSHNYYKNIFLPTINMQNNYILNALSEEVANVYINNGFSPSRINVLRNGAREDLFRYTQTPIFSHKSIYIGKIELRKCQYKYQIIENIDFVGNVYNSSFDINNKNYLGEWDKHTLYNNLTEYGNLLLLSDGEADPLVVKEALISGLGVVVSECAKANLDLSKPFITVIPDDKLNDILYVKNEIKKNLEVCKKNREEIRNYGLEIFSWEKIIKEYKNLLVK